MKKVLSVLLGVSMLASVAMASVGCGDSSEVLVWTFTDEVSEMIKEDYVAANPGVKVKTTKYVLSSLANKLSNALSTGKNLPDIVALDAKYVLQFIGLGAFETLNEIADSANMYQYTLDLATNNSGGIEGLSWQVTPGAFFYRTDLAELAGITSPEQMSARISTWSGFLETAATFKALNVHMLASLEEPIKLYLSNRESGWIDRSGSTPRLNIDASLYEGDDNPYGLLKTLQENEYVDTSCDGELTKRWYADMSSQPNKETGEKGTLGYFMSTWGYYYYLKDNAVNTTTGYDTAGKWACCMGPSSFYEGGTWLFVLKGSPRANQAKEIVKYLTSDATFLRRRAETLGDFVNNKTIMNDLATNYAGDPFLKDSQNHYALLTTVAEQIDGTLLSEYDPVINQAYKNSLVGYAMQDDPYISTPYFSITEALNAFKAEIQQSAIKNYIVIE